MTDWLVRWEANSFGQESAREAAWDVKALFFPDRHQGVFDIQPVDDPTGARWERIDLAGPADGSSDSVVWEYGHKALFKMAQQLVKDDAPVSAILEMLEKPWNWAELLREAVLSEAFDEISSGKDEPDLEPDDTDQPVAD